ncbi:MAG: 23S rRNA (uracil(1939)-C(5))-methyltransferase RlmD [Clostridia bacterium]|nr:23S rRNA (uracil(1939)-C(5))-methyltransferase RlmD [Clostridia bacterium]
MKKNDIIELEITGYSSDGNGIGRHNGGVVFVPFSAKGDRLLVKIIKVTTRYLVGRIEEILTPSPDRVSPACSFAGKCGGCAFMHITYEAELEAKKGFVSDALKRLGGLDIEVETILGAEEVSSYRNKACFPVSCENGEIKCGFYAPRSHRIVSDGNCDIQSDVANRVRGLTVDFMKKHGIKPYDEKTQNGLVRHVFVRSGDTVCVMLVLTEEKLPFADEYITLLKENIENLQSVVINVNRASTNVITGDKYITVFGDGYMTDTLCGLKFNITAASFYQVNRRQCERLYTAALDMADITENDTVLDLYCGIGTITLLEAKRAKKAIGVEIVPQAIDDAKKNAKINGISNAEFFCGDAAQAARRLKDEGIKADVVTVDPPRQGLDADLINTISDISPDRLVYVSCNSATLARDLKLLKEKGYEARKAIAVDMFPRTKHCEVVCALQRQRG